MKKSGILFIYLHPAASLVYFCAVIGFSMFVTDPIYIVISLSGGIASSIMVCGLSSFRRGLKFIVPLCLIAIILNPLFNHRGSTILFYLFTGNPITLESIIFGVAASLMLMSVLVWFMIFNKVFTTDKIVCLFGRVFPSFSLIISMSLRFVPRFADKFKEVSLAQKCLGKGLDEKNIIKKARNFIRILYAMIAWSLENSIETSDSMKARGYGLADRTSYTLFRFESKDAFFASLSLIFSLIVLISGGASASHFIYFPEIDFNTIAGIRIAGYFFFSCLCFMPILPEFQYLKKLVG